MQSDTLLTGKQRNDWTRSRQALLTLRAYGELVTQFPTNYASQLDKIKEFYDALVNEERPPHGCTKAMLLCPWRSAQPTEMKGQEIMNRALATRLEVRDVIVPAAMKVMVGGKCPSGKSEEETLGLILDILWRAAEEKRVAEAEKRVKRQTNKENEQETEVEETNKRPGSAGGIRPIKATRPPDFQPVGWVAFMALSPLWNPAVKPAVFRVMLDPRETFELQPAERAAVSRAKMREDAKEQKGFVNRAKLLANTAESAASVRASASQVAAASMALQALHQAADRREARLEKAIALERDPCKRAQLEAALMAVLVTDIKPSPVLLNEPEEPLPPDTDDSRTHTTEDTDAAFMDTTASSIAPQDEEDENEDGRAAWSAVECEPAVESAPFELESAPLELESAPLGGDTDAQEGPREDDTERAAESAPPAPERAPLARSASVTSNSEGGEFAAISAGKKTLAKRAKTSHNYASVNTGKSR